MYIQTQRQYTTFESDELTELMGKMTFQINNFGVWKSDHDTKASYISNDIEIVYYKEGGSTTIIGDKKYHCPQGSFLIIEPFQLNTSINEGYSQYSYYYFHFEIEPFYLRQQFLTLLTKHGHLIYPQEIQDYSEMLDRLVLEAQHKELGYSSIITSALIRLLVQMIRIQLKRGKDQHIEIVHSPYVQLVNESIKYIQNHIFEPIRITNLSQSLGVSSSVLYKAFVNVLDTPPATYIHQQKIQYAQKKLSLGKSVTEVAQELGYSSAYHLSKAFKKMTGMSPKDYKKTISHL